MYGTRRVRTYVRTYVLYSYVRVRTYCIRTYIPLPDEDEKMEARAGEIRRR